MKSKCYAFGSYKQRNKVCLVHLERKLQFQVKMPENGTKNIFREKKTANKEPVMFLDIKLLTGR